MFSVECPHGIVSDGRTDGVEQLLDLLLATQVKMTNTTHLHVYIYSIVVLYILYIVLGTMGELKLSIPLHISNDFEKNITSRRADNIVWISLRFCVMLHLLIFLK